MKLIEMLSNVNILDINVNMNKEIEHITNDSRKVTKNTLFFAIKGYADDGYKYIKSAFEKGAVCVVCDTKPDEDVPYILVANVRLALAKISSNFYNNPAHAMKILGITGTNGKTTTTYLVKHILETLGRKVGLIGTNQNMIGDKVIETERTTPESFELFKLFSEMKDAGCEEVCIEVSSHSLSLDRVGYVPFYVGAFTNLSQDHLDFHKTIDEYAKAKSILFKKCKIGVINLDDLYSNTMISDADCSILTYGINNNNADIKASNVEYFSSKVVFDVEYKNERVLCTLQIPGKFSVYNALTAIGVTLALGYKLEDIISSLKTATGVKGRIEVVPTNTDYTVLIDYAHSPDGITNVLNAVKGFAKGRIISLFGCGGDRDKTKRPLMAKACLKNSDFIIVTSDNPRTEQPELIINDIVEGLKDTEVPYKVITDRKEAIKYALSICKKDDVLVLMGKGHETYQEINHKKNHLDEREEVLNYFN